MRRIALIFAILLISIAALVSPMEIRAAIGLVSCVSGTTCTVGEFLYDDSYLPITNATCTLTSRYPDGTVFLLATPSGTTDGWYAQSFTTPGTTGTYRSQICCLVGADNLCLNKGFTVTSAPQSPLTSAEVTAAVWEATRSAHLTIGTFGEVLQSLAPSSGDVAAATWNYSSRSLSTFGSLLTDVSALVKSAWHSDPQIAQVTTTSQETRVLLERLVNKPVVETTTEEIPDLQSKIQETDGVVNQLAADFSYVNSSVDLMKMRWGLLDNGAALETVQDLIRKLGGENDAVTTNSVFGEMAYLDKSWDWNEIVSSKAKLKAVRDVLISLGQELEAVGPSKLAYNQVKALSGLTGQLFTVAGNPKDKPEQKTLFGKVAQTKLLASSLQQRSVDLEAVLGTWDNLTSPMKEEKLNQLAKQIAGVNRIPNVGRTLLAFAPLTEKDLKNRGYYLSGIIGANQKLLAANTGQVLANTWLELGSIVFKSLVSNPSALISQTVSVNYYLPPEVKKDNVISVDDGLTVKYDNTKDQYYVSGEFLLAPSQTKTVAVHVADLWVVSQQEVDSLRQQAAALSALLEKTSFFAQGVTLKSDIDVSLDKVLLLSKSNTTPENKIRAYREAQIELAAAKEKIGKLKELVAQAGSVGTIFGFVGGAQAVSVWGLILILAAGFVFLALYMRILIKKEEVALAVVKKSPLPPTRSGRHFGLIAVLILTLGMGVMAGYMLGTNNLPLQGSQIMGQTTIQELKK